mmetsp:Transcript_10004/g.24974  ORF Transcript_10004/g.24974 Transcript_10004/m.24974 type:complete len:824 (+) Transcript_10004:273-2744(+)
MNNPSHNGENHRRQQPHAPPGHPSLPPQYQHHLQHRPQDPQLALLLANAAAARGQSPSGGHPGHLGAVSNHNGGGFVNSGHFGNLSERHGGPRAMSQSTAAQLFEEQILQRASALRAEALMQQQQQQNNQYNQQQSQQHQQQLQIQAALKAIQQQHQLSSLNGGRGTAQPSQKTSPHLKPSDPHQQLLHQQQEAALLARAAALRELGLAGSPGSGSPASALLGAAGGTPGLDRLREQLDINALMRHRQEQQHQQQQQSQQRSPYGIEQELERVRQAQRLAANGSPKPSASAVKPKAAESASGILGSVSAAPSAVRETVSSSKVASVVQKTKPAEVSERPVASIPRSPKPKTEASQKEKGGLGTSNRSTHSKSSLSSSGTSSVLPKTGRTTPPLKPNPRSTSLAPEQSKQTKETAGAGAAAAAAVRCKTKEELRKNPGTVIVPCRARGMPMDHNFISAYFVISEDAKHGENLVCSYYACRNGGIKFRYCAYCMAPVAKRNFSRRHDHGMSKKKGANSIREEEEDEEDDDDTFDESENTGSDKGSMSSSGIPLQTSAKRPTEPSAPEIESKRQRLEADTTTTEEKDSDIGEEVSSKRRSMWNDLLNKRPRTKDPNALSSWLNEVLALSDLQFPLEEVGGDMDRPLGKLPLNEMPKLTKPAATPSEDEAIDSSEAIDTMDSSPSHSIADDQVKDSTNNESVSRSNSDAATTNSADIVIGEENLLSASPDNQKESKSASRNVKDETTESQKPDEETTSAKADPQNSVSGNGAKLLGKKSKLSSKKSVFAGKGKMKKKEDEGFAGSFADWRDRKKGKSLKKGPSSLRK